MIPQNSTNPETNQINNDTFMLSYPRQTYLNDASFNLDSSNESNHYTFDPPPPYETVVKK